MTQPRIGFIGQGWIGKNYADDFERRGHDVVRYSLEEPYVANKEAITDCDIVFIAVPTPTTTEGFDDSYLRSALPNVGPGNIAVIKSTLLPGTTEKLQNDFPHITVFHSPEFLREANAAYDAAHPERNIIGIPTGTPEEKEKADLVLQVLATAPYARVMSARSAELVKYAGNTFLAVKVVYANILYDFANALGVPYEEIYDAVGNDPRIGHSHLNPISASGHTDKEGRGAGGHCFIKDLEAFRLLYEDIGEDAEGSRLLASVVRKNNELLKKSEKDMDLLSAVYGEEHPLLP